MAFNDSVSECDICWARGDRTAGVTAYSGSRLKGRIERLASECPDEVQVIARNSDGSVFAHVPANWVRVSPPRKVSEEQRLASAERLKAFRLGTAREPAEGCGNTEPDGDTDEDMEDDACGGDGGPDGEADA